jgi:hypothetical protein
MKINILKNNKVISTIYPENNRFTIDEDIDLNCEFEIETETDSLKKENQKLKEVLTDVQSVLNNHIKAQ